MKKNLIALMGLAVTLVTIMAQQQPEIPDYEHQDPFDPSRRQEWKQGEDPASAARIAAWKAPAAILAIIGDKPRPVTLRVIETLEHYQVGIVTHQETRDWLIVQSTAHLLKAIPELTDQQILRLIKLPPAVLRK